MPPTTVKPVKEPVTLADVKKHVRITSDKDDDLLAQYIMASRLKCENYCKRSLITQTKTLCFIAMGDSIELPLAPVQAVVRIEYKDSAGVYQEWSSANYATFKNNTFFSEIRRTKTSVIPTFLDNDPEAWKVTYICGYGDNPDDVPMALRMGILVDIQNLFDYRGEKPTPVLAEMLWDTEKVARIR